MLSNIKQDEESLQPLSRREIAEEQVWVRQTIGWCVERAGLGFVSITVQFAPRFTACMGKARVTSHEHRQGLVRLSASPLWRRASPVKRRNTVVHETAHILANIKAGRNVGHGPAWKAMMRLLGEEPKRCHTVPRDGLRRRRGAFRPVAARPAQPRAVAAVVASGAVVAPQRVPLGVSVTFRAQGLSACGIADAPAPPTGAVVRLRVVGDHARAIFGTYITVPVESVRG